MTPDTSRSPSRGHASQDAAYTHIHHDRGLSESPPSRRKSGSGARVTSVDEAPRHSYEHSPLLSPEPSRDESCLTEFDNPTQRADYHGDEGQGTKSMLYLFILVVSIGGLQIAWCVELSNGTPFLLSLGLSKSLMALVWIAGPLSGTLVQPYVGIRSDNSRLRWGKRKPFMIGGAVATIVSLLMLAWTREISRGITSLFGIDAESGTNRKFTIILAVLLVYILDFAINTVQAAIRAFIIDCAPTHQQESANAWASRVTGVGNILGYLSGYVNLPSILPFFGDTQFKVLCVIASISLGATVAISVVATKERDPRMDPPPSPSKSGVLSFFRQVFSSIRRLPPQIRSVCEVQFFAWIGWFPFLFYITTYIGQLYVNPLFEANPHMTPAEIDAAWEHATRIGTFALLIFAITSFAASIILPLLIAPSFAPIPSSSSKMAAPSSSPSYLSRLIIPSLTLRRAWLFSLLAYAFTVFLTLFVTTPTGGTILVGLIGIAWAVTLWAPFALIASEISKREALRRRSLRQSSTLLQRSSRQTVSTIITGNARESDGYEDQAGIILGLHNVAIAAPQIISTLGSSLLFRWMQKPRGTAGDDSVGWVLRIGAVASLVAAYMCTRVRDEGEQQAQRVGKTDDVERGRAGHSEEQTVGLLIARR